MHIPTVLSVKDADDRRPAPRFYARADIRDLSRAETLRSPQSGSDLFRTSDRAMAADYAELNSPWADLEAREGRARCLRLIVRISLIVGTIAACMIIGAIIALTIGAMQTAGLADNILSFAAPTTLESQSRSIEQLVGGAR
ncbi:hypothetical protein QWZ10_19270 [Paracoccus cavernae]|uniref:ABC transporter permease n=2 Tax=Paracoccus cavernae TaxID=1571207 RepID=A0ABT8D983_9RHOB|nr:hypothetical protein [Paracoccus cavernae]